MEFQEFCKQRKRMCKTHSCLECPLSVFKNSICCIACIENCEKAEMIVRQWAENYPEEPAMESIKEE